MKQFPDKYFDLAISDPPYFKGVAKQNFYGSDICKAGVKRKKYKTIESWDDNIPDEKYFNELIRVSKDQIIWGINYFKFIHCSGRIIWDKLNDHSTFSKCEIASCSLIDSVQQFRYKWNGFLQENMKNKEEKIHPTQKPVALYSFLFKNYAKPGFKILDTHLGSGSSRIAAFYAGLDFVGFEIDEEYFKMQEQKFILTTGNSIDFFQTDRDT